MCNVHCCNHLTSGDELIFEPRVREPAGCAVTCYYRLVCVHDLRVLHMYIHACRLLLFYIHDKNCIYIGSSMEEDLA